MDIGQKIMHLHSEGITNRKISQLLNCSASTVSQWILKFKWDNGKLNLDDLDDKAKEIIRLRKLGNSISAIAGTIGCSKSTASKYCTLLSNYNKKIFKKENNLNCHIINNTAYNNINTNGILESQTNSTMQGIVGVAAAIHYFASKGYKILIPLQDVQEYDLVIEVDGKLNKIQVKTSRHVDSNTYKVCLYMHDGSKKFNASYSDFVFILVGDGSTYLIPSDVLDGFYHINMGPKYQEYQLS